MTHSLVSTSSLDKTWMPISTQEHSPLAAKLLPSQLLQQICQLAPTLSSLRKVNFLHLCDTQSNLPVGIVEEDQHFINKHYINVVNSFSPVIKGQAQILLTNESDKEVSILKGTTIAHISPGIVASKPTPSDPTNPKDTVNMLMTRANPKLTSEQKKDLSSLLSRYVHVFSSKLITPGAARVPAVRIKVKDDTKPKFIRNYRTSAQERNMIDAEIEKLVQNGVVEPCPLVDPLSQWNFPVLPLEKPDNTKRMCVDFRYLNSNTLRENTPLPRLDNILDDLAGSIFFSMLDMTQGFYQFLVHPSDRQYLTFSSSNKQYRFRVMPFGITNAPSTFQRVISLILNDIRHVAVYIDNILIFTASWKDHLTTLEAVLKRLSTTNLILKPEKCDFALLEITVFGHQVAANGIWPTPEKIEAITNMPEPLNSKDVKSFLGAVNYFRRFIDHLSELEAPLRDVEKTFSWGPSQITAFKTLKERLSSPPVLKFFEPSSPIILHVDASDRGIAGVLVQPIQTPSTPTPSSEKSKIKGRFDLAPNEHPIAFYSRMLKGAETRYDATRKELLALHQSVKYFRPYLYGHHFDAFTDHNSLIGLMKNNNGIDSPPVARAITYLSSYDMTLNHRPGILNGDADALSRLPVPDESLKSEVVTLFNISSVNEYPTSTGDWIKAQSSDLNLMPIIASLKDHKPHQELKLRDDLLVTKAGQIVVPNSLQTLVTEDFHNCNFGGHYGFEKTYASIAQRYFWKGMSVTIRNFCESCTSCIQKLKRRAIHGIPTNLPFGSAWEIIFMDSVGPLPVGNNGERHILLVVDSFTKNIEVEAMQSVNSSAIISFLYSSVVARHGTPKIVLSDQAKAFLSIAVNAFYSSLGITGKKIIGLQSTG